MMMMMIDCWGLTSTQTTLGAAGRREVAGGEGVGYL